MADRITSHWPISLTNGAAAVFNLFLPLALVRILPPEEVGRYKVFFLYVMLSPGLFLTSGLNNGLYHWAGKYPETKPEIRQSWTWLIAATLGLSAIGLLFAGRLARLLAIGKFDLSLLFVSGPVILSSMFLEDLMIARGNIWTGSLYGSALNVLRAAGIVAAAYWGRSMELVLWTFFGCMTARAAVGALLLFKSGEITPIFSTEESSKVLRYALPVSIAALAGLVLQNVDQMILSFRLDPREFAFYAMGCLTVPPLQILESSVNRVLIPRLSRAFAAGETSEAAASFKEGVLELYRFILPAVVGLMIYSQPIVWILFTERYMPAARYLRIYALSYLCLAFPFDIVARARGNGSWILRTTLLFVPVSILATWFCADRWGAMGALIASLAAGFVMRLYPQWYHRRSFMRAFSEFMPFKEMSFHTGVALAAGACCVLLKPLFSDARTWLVATGPMFAAVYLGCTYVFHSKSKQSQALPDSVRVLELVQTFRLGGLERMVYSLARALHQREPFQVLVVGYDHQDGERSLVPLFQEAGIAVVHWKKAERFSLRSAARLVRILFSQKTRILHAHDLGPLIYGSLAKLCSLGRVRLVLTLHTLLDIERSRRYRLYYKIFLRFPDRIVAVSTAVKSGLVALGVDASRIDVVPNGAVFPAEPARSMEDKFALRLELMPHLSSHLLAAWWMLCLGRLNPGKGQDVVLDVWSALPAETRSGSILLLVGQETREGYEEILRQKLRAAPDSDRIILAGPSARPEDWVRASDLFISGSRHEGMPLAPLEAAGCGLPTVLSDIEGHRFLNSWAHYFDPEKPAGGAERVREIMEAVKNRGEARFFQETWRATEPLRRQWSVAAMAASYAKIFKSIGKSNSSTHIGDTEWASLSS